MNAGWGFWLLIAAAAALHFLLRLTLGLGEYAPDLLTVAVLLGARQVRPGAGAGLGFVAGLLRDAIATSRLGAGALVLTVLGYFGSRSRDVLDGEGLVFTAIYVFVGKWLHDVAHGILTGRALLADPARTLLVELPIAALVASASGILLVIVYRSFAMER